jgi:outer membrane protein OmpA-like peptidoglycan-associated protein
MKYLILSLFLFASQQLFAQGLINKIKSKAQEKIGTTSKSKKETSSSESNNSENPTDTIVPEKNSDDTSITKTDNDLGAYRKFGFVRGSDIIFQDSFEDDAIGDYPKRWNSDAGGEVVSLKKYGGNWLKSAESAHNFADFLKSMPINFTLEFDVISDAKSSSDYNSITVMLASSKGGKSFLKTKNQEEVSGFNTEIDLFKGWLAYNNLWNITDSTNESYMEIISPITYSLEKFNYTGQPLHVSMVRQDARLVLYINTTRVFDIRNAFVKNTLLNNLMFKTYSRLEDQTSGLYISNIILAETVSDSRKDLFVDGKYVTNSILFETNSDKIQPSSLPSITVVADYMNSNPTVKLKVVGHTDNVGDDASNLSLSARRAASVLNELVGFHKIDKARLSAEGKGETQPITDNATKEGKAKNRRVEFIKQ